MDNRLEFTESLKLSKKLHTPLNANGNEELAKSFLKGGYKQEGYGVPEGASIDGSFSIGDEGSQGYYVDQSKDVFVSTVNSMNAFFARRAKRNGKPIKYVIKPGIGGQHTPFQAIADAFNAFKPEADFIVAGEYELGKDYEKAIKAELKRLKAGWDQIAIIPSSKSGSTDETMLIFTDLFYVLLKNIAEKEGIDGKTFADIVLDTLHDVNFVDGAEKPGKDLFKGFSISLAVDNLKKNPKTKDADYNKVKKILGVVLGNMFFETTDRVEQSRLSAFIRNSGLDNELDKEDVPGFGAMFDNVGGRWTADLHMMTFLAYYDLDPRAYLNVRLEGIKLVRAGNHKACFVANKILDKKFENIALLVPKELFWFGKAIEQNFNESIWQEGFLNLNAVRKDLWSKQKSFYSNKNSFVLNLSGARINNTIPSEEVNIFDEKSLKGYQDAAEKMGELFTYFYGITHTVGNRLIIRALDKRSINVDSVNLNDLNNAGTKVVQENLYLRQPYVELGKGLVEARLKDLQKIEASKKGAIPSEFSTIKQKAKEGIVESNITGIKIPQVISSHNELNIFLNDLSEYAVQSGRKLVPFVYLDGKSFYKMRDAMLKNNIQWVMQGTGDQHISYQQVLAQPKKFLVFIISFIPKKEIPGHKAIGFAKGYLNDVSPHMVRDFFAEASYKALTELRKDVGGEGVFLRMTQLLHF